MANRSAYVQEIERAILAARTFVEEHGQLIWGRGKEIQTCTWIIEPMIRALGWNINDPNQVWVQYPVTRARGILYPDYGFFGNDPETPIMILEAKSIPKTHIDSIGEEQDEEDWDEDDEWEDDEDDWYYDEEIGEFRDQDVDQLRRQCRGLSRGYGVLSCGSLWSIFDLIIPGNPRSANGFLRKRIAHINILSSPTEECVEALQKIHRRNVGKLR